MVNYYVGIDGGGTKTAFALADEKGRLLAAHEMGSADYKQITVPGVVMLVQEGLGKLEQISGLELMRSPGSVCFGMPMYGEIHKYDKQLMTLMEKQLSGYRIKVVNDVEAGWAGSLSGGAGINIVSGTGSIAYGRDDQGNCAKAGGWSEYFSDEGSCNWLGIRTIEYFAKEADGRLDRGPLYNIVREHFGLKEDVDIIPVFEETYMPSRKKRASLQYLLKEAAEQGDENAHYLYRQAAFELSLLVSAVYDKLHFHEETRVSYSGGLFGAGDWILAPFLAFLEEMGLKAVTPEMTPVAGAVLLASRYGDGKLDENNFKKQYKSF